MGAVLSALLGDELEAGTLALRVLWCYQGICASRGFAGELQSSPTASCWRYIPQHTNLFFLVIFHFLSHIQLVDAPGLKLLAHSLGAELSKSELLPAGACMGRRLLDSQERFGTQVLPAVPHHQAIRDGMRWPEQNLQTWMLWLWQKHKVKSESFQKTQLGDEDAAPDTALPLAMPPISQLWIPPGNYS